MEREVNWKLEQGKLWSVQKKERAAGRISLTRVLVSDELDIEGLEVFWCQGSKAMGPR